MKYRNGDLFSENRFEDFQNLMPFRVRDILFVSSLYDSFILGQDGQLNEMILSEFLNLNLFTVPNLSRISSGIDALSILEKTSRFDMIITTTHIGDLNVIDFTKKVKKRQPKIPVILLAFDNRELKSIVENYNISLFEKVFLWQGDFRILMAIVKYVEDKLNVRHDTKLVGVQSIILIEDNIRYYSSFLPMIFAELMKHSHKLISEGVNIAHKILRMRARAKILLCNNYEEASKYFKDYRENILGIISDIEFPRNDKLDKLAGIKFCRRVRKYYTDVPIILQSSQKKNAKYAREIDASFLLKNSPTMLSFLRRFMIENFGFGDFIFRLENGKEVNRASNLKGLQEILRTVDAESIRYHAERNHFSKWLKARTEFALADKLRPRRVSEFSSIEDVRDHLINSLEDFRSKMTQGVIEDFDRSNFSIFSRFARIGGGSIGGKARGMAFISALLNKYNIRNRFKDVHIFVPATVILGTEVFDQFLEMNSLREFVLNSSDDAEILKRFNEAQFPYSVSRDLIFFLEKVKYPLAVRSSSLLEDSQYQPFSGIYKTFMIPNNHADINIRLLQLINAIRKVYASTYLHLAKMYIKATPYRLEEEKMAVIIQKIVGTNHNGRFYPNISGVARSYNYYPTAPMTVDDGIASVAFGFGQTVVEGGSSFRFCPRYPNHNMQFANVGDMLDFAQKRFYSLNMDCNNRAEFPSSKDLESQEIFRAKEDGTLGAIASIYSPENDVIYDGLSRKGIPFISFAPILKHKLFPLADVLKLLLELGSWGVSVPVEIEFAVNLSTPKGKPKEFGFLQMRPLIITQEMDELNLEIVEENDVICRSNKVLGHGIIQDIHNIVLVDRKTFDRSKTKEIAYEVGKMNAKLVSEEKPYLLIGLGRWGSSDSWLGIPVTWSMINGARVIIETNFTNMKVTPSQGAHFFQNLTTFGINYFTIDTDFEENFLNWEWLLAQKPVKKNKFVRQLQFKKSLQIIVDGTKHQGLITKPGVKTSQNQFKNKPSKKNSSTLKT